MTKVAQLAKTTAMDNSSVLNVKEAFILPKQVNVNSAKKVVLIVLIMAKEVKRVRLALMDGAAIKFRNVRIAQRKRKQMTVVYA